MQLSPCALMALLTLALSTTASRADAPSAPGANVATLATDSAVEAALAEAGANRSELAAFLERAAGSGDAEKAQAARFLVANMPGRGFVPFTLRDAEGEAVAFDPLQVRTFAEAQARLDELERVHGVLDFVRGDLVQDLQTLSAAHLVRHLDLAFEVWRGTPAARRPDFATFCDFVLPYRGSEESAEDWLTPLVRRLAAERKQLGPRADPAAVWEAVNADARRDIRFDERYYLHPTDQGFAEMETTRMGRCEDITNRTTYGARALGLAIATDYTPAWAHSDNNHAWNVLLDPEGRGTDPVGRRAAKVYRKTFSRHAESLADQLPPGRAAPNRWIASPCQIDVTDQYGPTTDVTVAIDPKLAAGESLAYLCVFNGGRWVALQFGRIEDGTATFAKMGRDVLYLPAVHDGEKLVAVAPPLLLRDDGSVELLPGRGPATDVVVRDVRPRDVRPRGPKADERHERDERDRPEASRLTAGTTYELSRWQGGAWTSVSEATAGAEPLTFTDLPSDGLFWLVAAKPRRLERPFVLVDGRQHFW